MIPRLNGSRYTLLKAEEKGEAGSTSDEQDFRDDTLLAGASINKSSTSRFTRLTFKLAFVASLIANVALAIALYHAKASLSEQISLQTPQSFSQTTPQQPQREKSRYAELEYNFNSTWESETVYAQENVTAADEEWMAMDINPAFVALTKEHASRLGLPLSLPFPWDLHKKDLYLISSIHSMHCLTVLHRSNLEYRTDHTQTYSTEHILHCLDNIRVDLECSADDTPRYIPRDAPGSTVKTGIGQIRQCRDWSKLISWAKEHSACFSYNTFLTQELKGEGVYPFSWEYCDKDNEYLPYLQNLLDKGPDWVAPDPGFPEIDEIQKHH